MLVYTDLISNDELCSDSFNVKEVDGIVYEVECKNLTKGPVSVNIGANPTTGEGEEVEDAGEAVDDSAVVVNDVVDAFRLEETPFDKKSYMTYLKGYIKSLRTKIEASNPSRVPEFEAAAQNYAKKILGNFDNYRFYQGENMDPEAMVCLLESRGDKEYMIYWKDGLKTQKY